MAVDKNALLAFEDVKKVPIDLWGANLFVRGLTGADKDRLEGRLKNKPFQNVRAAIAIASLVDEDGKQVFSWDDLEAVGRKSAESLDKILEAANKLNSVTDDDVTGLEGKSEPMGS